MNDNNATCQYCQKEITPEDNSYFSQQAGMKGHYHWSCFVNACRKANRIGAQQVEALSTSSDADED